MTEWVNVKDGLPSENHIVITYTDTYLSISKWDGKRWKDAYTPDNEWDWARQNVNYWMPISTPRSAEQVDEWICFSEQLPKHNQMIKVRSNNSWHGEGIFQDGKFVYSWVKGATFGNPTHWMPLHKQSSIHEETKTQE